METKKVLLWVLVIVLIAGLIVSAFLFKDKINPNYEIKASELKSDAEALEDFKKDLDKLAKGGFTIEQSKIMQADADCPTQNDQYFESMKCYEYKSFVVFTYSLYTDDGVIYPNIVFRKVEDKLSLDGIMNATLICKRGGFLGLGSYNWKNAYIKIDFSQPPNYNYKMTGGLVLNPTIKDNYVSLISDKIYYWTDYNHNRVYVSPSKSEVTLAREFASKALLDVVEKYFLQFDNLRLQTLTASGANVYSYLNSYFAYLYNSCSKVDNVKSIINVNEFLTYDIPDDEQKNYPIPESKKADYPSDWKYYKMYKCDKYVNVTYVKKTSLHTLGTSTSSDYEEKVECVVVPAQEKKYAHQVIKLRNYDNADLLTYDATKNPVQITFTANDEEAKTIIFNNKSQFSEGVNALFTSGKTYKYTITSNVLYFENIEGSFVAKDNTTWTLNFKYYNNASMCSFGLNAIGTIDFTQINLAEHPVTVTFSTGQSIVWNSNDSFDTRQSVLLTFGEIEYTILSDALTFATATGKFTVDTSTRTILFNCAGSAQSAIVLSALSTDSSVSDDYKNNIILSFSRTDLQSFTFAGYALSAYLYDGEVQYKLEECVLSSTGTSSWDTSTLCYVLPSNFDITAYGEDYHVYKLQLQLSNGTKVYLSNLLDFKRYYDENNKIYGTNIQVALYPDLLTN